MVLKNIREISGPRLGLATIQPTKKLSKLKEKKQAHQVKQLQDVALKKLLAEQAVLEKEYTKYGAILSESKDLDEYEQKWSLVPATYQQYFYTPTEARQNVSTARSAQITALDDKIALYNRKIAHYRQKEANARGSDEQVDRLQAKYSDKQEYYSDMISEVTAGRNLVAQGKAYTNASILQQAANVASGYYNRSQLEKQKTMAEKAGNKIAIEKALEAQKDQQRKNYDLEVSKGERYAVPATKKPKFYGNPQAAKKTVAEQNWNRNLEGARIREQAAFTWRNASKPRPQLESEGYYTVRDKLKQENFWGQKLPDFGPGYDKFGKANKGSNIMAMPNKNSMKVDMLIKPIKKKTKLVI